MNATDCYREYTANKAAAFFNTEKIDLDITFVCGLQSPQRKCPLPHCQMWTGGVRLLKHT